jgi:hypothetical protein
MRITNWDGQPGQRETTGTIKLFLQEPHMAGVEGIGNVGLGVRVSFMLWLPFLCAARPETFPILGNI